MENEQLNSQYTHYMADKLLCFIHELKQTDKSHTMNRLKGLITEETIEINMKYARPYTARNTVNYVMFSNHLDAIMISRNDRRLFVVHNEKQPPAPEYFERLVKTIDNHFGAIYNYLLNRNLSGFNPNKRPDHTIGKTKVMEHSRSELHLYLDSIYREQEGPFDKKILTTSEILNHVENFGPNMVKNRVSQKAISNWLQQAGFIKTPVTKRVNGKHTGKNYWHLPDVNPREEINKTEENAF